MNYPGLIGKGQMLLGEEPAPTKGSRDKLIRDIDTWLEERGKIGDQPRNREFWGVTLSQLTFRLQEKRAALAAHSDEERT